MHDHPHDPPGTTISPSFPFEERVGAALTLALGLVQADDAGLRSIVGTQDSPVRVRVDVTVDPSGQFRQAAVILLTGIRTESALARVAAELDELRVPVAWFDQRQAAETACRYRVDGDGPRGTLRLGLRSLRLEEVAAVYTRLMDDRFLPELRGLPADVPERAACRRLHDTFSTDPKQAMPRLAIIGRWPNGLSSDM